MKKINWGLLIKVGISVSMMGLVVYKLYPKLPELIAMLKTMDKALLAAGFCIELASMSLWVVRQHILFKAQKIVISYWEIFKLTMIGMFFNNLLMGANGGDVIKGYFLIKKTPDKKPQAIACMFIDRVLGVGTLWLIVFGMLLFYSDNQTFKPVLVTCQVVLVLIIIAGTMFVLSKKFAQELSFLKKFVPNEKVIHFIQSFHDALWMYSSKKTQLTLAILCSFVLQFMSIAMMIFFGYALGIENIGVTEYLLIVPIGFFINALPISVGGWGVGEVAFLSLFSLFNVAEEKAIALAFLMHLAFLAVGMIGSVFYITEGIKVPDKLKSTQSLEDLEN